MLPQPRNAARSPGDLQCRGSVGVGRGEGPAPLEVRFASGPGDKVAAVVDGGHALQGTADQAGGGGWGGGLGRNMDGGVGGVGLEGKGVACGGHESEEAAMLVPRRVRVEARVLEDVQSAGLERAAGGVAGVVAGPPEIHRAVGRHDECVACAHTTVGRVTSFASHAHQHGREDAPPHDTKPTAQTDSDTSAARW